MKISTVDVARKINVAKSELEKALVDLHDLRAGEASPHYAHHLLRNFLRLTKILGQNLRRELVEYPVEDVHIYIDALEHTTELMGRITESASLDSIDKATLQWEEVEIAVTARRLTEHYRRRLMPSHIKLDFDAAVSTSRVWTDRVLTVVILDNIFSTAARRSPDAGKIIVHVEEMHDRVLCSLKDQGPHLAPEKSAISSTVMKIL